MRIVELLENQSLITELLANFGFEPDIEGFPMSAQAKSSHSERDSIYESGNEMQMDSLKVIVNYSYYS